MGTSEKRKRRAANRIFQSYTVLVGNTRIPLRDSPSAKDLLREFAAPFAPFAGSEQLLYFIAISAWNLSQFDDERRARLTDELVTSLSPGATEASRRLRDVLDALVERRVTLYRNETIAFIPNRDDA